MAAVHAVRRGDLAALEAVLAQPGFDVNRCGTLWQRVGVGVYFYRVLHPMLYRGVLLDCVFYKLYAVFGPSPRLCEVVLLQRAVPTTLPGLRLSKGECTALHIAVCLGASYLGKQPT